MYIVIWQNLLVGFSWDTKFVGQQLGAEVLKILTLLRRWNGMCCNGIPTWWQWVTSILRRGSDECSSTDEDKCRLFDPRDGAPLLLRRASTNEDAVFLRTHDYIHKERTVHEMTYQWLTDDKLTTYKWQCHTDLLGESGETYHIHKETKEIIKW